MFVKTWSLGLTRTTSCDHENVKEFFENLNECVSRHTFTSNEIYLLDMTGNELFISPPKSVWAKE